MPGPSAAGGSSAGLPGRTGAAAKYRTNSHGWFCPLLPRLLPPLSFGWRHPLTNF